MEALLHELLHDTVMMLPFLYLTYLLMEYMEHRSSTRMQALLFRTRSWGPLLGALLGILPQCGFSVLASGLYVNRTITLGTLLAVFVATSDEAVPILLANPEQAEALIGVIIVKVFVAAGAGLLTDRLLRDRHHEIATSHHDIHEHCAEDAKKHPSLFALAFFHALRVFLFIFVINALLSVIIHYAGEEALAAWLISGSYLQPVLAAIVGFIPNCAASVMLSQLYLEGVLTFGSLCAGLITGAGLGLLALWRMYDNKRDIARIVFLLFVIGTGCGILLQMLVH